MVRIPLLALPLAAGCAAPAPLATARNGPVRATWEALLSSDCDLDRVHVYTPFEAKALRHTPYAIAGLAPSEESLRALFAQDGGWYEPRDIADPALEAPALRCVEKLAAHEESLRARLPVPPELEARILRDHALFQVLRQWSEAPENPYGGAEATRADDGTWSLWLVAPGCPPGEDCPGYRLTCPPEGPCEAVAVG